MDNIELSIIIPVYNIEKYIGECLLSILEIRDINYEILTINDGSADSSQEIIDKISANNNCIKTFVKTNGGVSDARNYGLLQAQGEYVWFIDGDDVVDPAAFEEFYSELKGENLDVALGNFKRFEDGNNELSPNRKLAISNKVLTGEGYLKLSNGVVDVYPWRIIYRRSFLVNNQIYFETTVAQEDTLFYPLTLLKAERVKYYDVYFYLYRIAREGSFTTDEHKHIEKKRTSMHKIVSILIDNLEFVNNSPVMKEYILSTYLAYLNTARKRDLELEKILFDFQGVFLSKLKFRYNLWRRTVLYKRYVID